MTTKQFWMQNFSCALMYKTSHKCCLVILCQDRAENLLVWEEHWMLIFGSASGIIILPGMNQVRVVSALTYAGAAIEEKLWPWASNLNCQQEDRKIPTSHNWNLAMLSYGTTSSMVIPWSVMTRSLETIVNEMGICTMRSSSILSVNLSHVSETNSGKKWSTLTLWCEWNLYTCWMK